MLFFRPINHIKAYKAREKSPHTYVSTRLEKVVQEGNWKLLLSLLLHFYPAFCSHNNPMRSGSMCLAYGLAPGFSDRLGV